jgi:hypothetical protein
MDKELFIENVRLVENVPGFSSEYSSVDVLNLPYIWWKCKDLLFFLKDESSSLRNWCNKFLEENRNELYVKYWLEHGWNHLNRHNEGTGNLRFPPTPSELHPEFLVYWEHIRSALGESEQNDFRFALRKLMDTHQIHEPSYCDVPEINKIHEGNPCRSNGWYCDDCEDMEHRWHRHLLENLKGTNNVFFVEKEKGLFLQKAIEANIAPQYWKPPSSNPRIGNHRNKINLQIDGKSHIQIMYKIVEFSSWLVYIYKYKSKDSFTKFNELWIFLEALEPKLEVLENACKQVEELVNQS